MLTDSNYLTVGVYKNGAGLTSVGGTGQNVTNNTTPNLNPTINLFGGKTGGNGNYSDGRSGNTIVGPANVQVKLTLVSETSSNTPSK